MAHHRVLIVPTVLDSVIAAHLQNRISETVQRVHHGAERAKRRSLLKFSAAANENESLVSLRTMDRTKDKMRESVSLVDLVG